MSTMGSKDTAQAASAPQEGELAFQQSKDTTRTPPQNTATPKSPPGVSMKPRWSDSAFILKLTGNNDKPAASNDFG
jgi:hypothetical protein